MLGDSEKKIGKESNAVHLQCHCCHLRVVGVEDVNVKVPLPVDLLPDHNVPR